MRYNVVIDYTKRAKIQIGKMHIKRDSVAALVNELILYIEDGEGHGVIKAKRLLFPPEIEYESTLYYFEIKQGIGILLTIDEDPIFEKVLVKIFSIGKPNKIEREFFDVLDTLRSEFIEDAEDEVMDFDKEKDNG